MLQKSYIIYFDSYFYLRLYDCLLEYDKSYRYNLNLINKRR